MGHTDPAGALSLGLLLDGTLPIPGLLSTRPLASPENLQVLQRISGLLDTMMGYLTARGLSPET